MEDIVERENGHGHGHGQISLFKLPKRKDSTMLRMKRPSVRMRTKCLLYNYARKHNTFLNSFLATSRDNLGKTLIKKQSACGLLATSESRFVLRIL